MFKNSYIGTKIEHENIENATYGRIISFQSRSTTNNNLFYL